MLQHIAFLFFIMKLIYCFNITIPDENSNNDQNLAKLAAKIFLEHCKIKCETSLVIYANSFLANCFFKEISIRNLDKGVYSINFNNFTANNTEGWRSAYKLDMTVILLENYDTVEEIIFNIELLSFWYLRSRFLVVAPGVDPDDDDEDWIEESFKSFWDRQTLRVIICFWKTGPKIYSYNPFLENFGIDVTNRSDLEQIFAHKIQNMNGNTITLYYLDMVYKNSRILKVTQNGKDEYFGLDGKFWGTLACWLNASLDIHYISEDFDEDMVNNADHDVPFRAFIEVLAAMYDFDIVATAGRTYEDNDLDHVFLYDRNDMLLVVPRGKQIPRYLYIFLIIPLDVWGLTLTSLTLVSLLELYVYKRASKHTDIIILFINNYRLLLNESAPSNGQHPQENFIMMVWIVFCIVFCALFQSVLMTTLVSPQYYPDIDTLEDLFNTDLDVYATHFSIVHLVRSLQDDNIKILDHLKKVPKDISVYGETMEWMDLYRFNYGILVSTEQVNYLKTNNKNAKRPDFHVVKDLVMPNAHAYNIRNEKLFYEEVLEAMGRIRQAGLYEFWIRYNYGINVDHLVTNSTTGKKEVEEDGEISLTLEHLEIAFVLMLLGTGLAAVALFFELLLYKCKI